MRAATAEAAADAGVAAAAEPAAEGVSEPVSGWAASFLDHSRKRRKVVLDDEDVDDDSSDSGAGEEVLTQAVLDRTFKDLTDSVRCARISAPRVTEHFAVNVRGCEKNQRTAGDRLDYARATFVGADVAS